MDISPEFESAIRKLGAVCTKAEDVAEVVGELPEEISSNDTVIKLVEIISSLGVASCELIQVFWSERGDAAEKKLDEALSKTINISKPE